VDGRAGWLPRGGIIYRFPSGLGAEMSDWYGLGWEPN
jgi:hypothetical protein